MSANFSLTFSPKGTNITLVGYKMNTGHNDRKSQPEWSVKSGFHRQRIISGDNTNIHFPDGDMSRK